MRRRRPRKVSPDPPSLARTASVLTKKPINASDSAVLRLATGTPMANSRCPDQRPREFAIGVPVANRRTAESEALIGFFVNTLAVRARLGGSGLTFRGLLRRMREASLGAYANQDVPFERV